MVTLELDEGEVKDLMALLNNSVTQLTDNLRAINEKLSGSETETPQPPE